MEITATSIDYFYFGSSNIKQDKVYGLYAYILNSFVLIDLDLEVIQKTCSILFPKIDTRIVEISAAKNYCVNMIDNSICENWSPVLEKNIDTTFLKNHLYNIILPVSLKKRYLTTKNKIKIQEVKKWAMMTAFWCRLFNDLQKSMFNVFPEHFMQNFIHLPDLHPDSFIVEQKILKELYLGINFEDTCCKIFELSKQNSTLYEQLQKKSIAQKINVMRHKHLSGNPE